MTNYFDKFREDIITGAESGFSGEVKDEASMLSNPYEDMEDDTKEIENLQETATALYSDKIKEVAEGDLIAGGEAAVARAAYRAKTMAKGGMSSAVNAFNKLAGRTSNIDKIMTKVAAKAKAAAKGLDKSGLPKDSEAKIEYATGMETYLVALITGITTHVAKFEDVLKTTTGSQLAAVSVPMLEKADNNIGFSSINKDAGELKTHLEDYSAGDVMESAKDAYSKVADDTSEVSLAELKTKLMKTLGTIETKAKTVKTDKASNALKKAASKLTSLASKDNTEDDKKSTAMELAQQISTAISGQISVLTRVVKFAELGCDKVVTAARALEAKLPSGK